MIDINFDNTLAWVQKGAEMSETARAILSYKGVLHKNHLLKGVAKGALTLEQAEAKFTQWLQEKDGKIEGKKDSLSKSASKEKAGRMKAEVEANIAKAAKIEAKNTVIEEEAVAEESVAEESVSEELVSDEAVSDEVIAEESVSEEAVAEEVIAEEVVAEEAVAEEVVAEETVAEESPEADEPSAEEAPAAE